MLDKFRYFILRALRNMRQWPFLCAASILTVAISLATIATFFLVVMNVQQLANRWSEDLQIVAYLDSQLSTKKLSIVVDKIEGFEEVASVQYVSQKEAMLRFKERLGDDGDLLDGVSGDILPASLEISLESQFRNRAGVDSVVESLDNTVEIDDIQYGQKWLERFESFVTLLKIIGFLLGSFLLFAALFIVSNTIKLTLFARRDELEIMALVGATRRFIKIPFLLEGAFQGMFGGLLSLFFLSIAYHFFLVQILRSFWLTPAGINLIFLNASQQFMLVFAGVFLGFLGSLTSLRKLVQY